jgi:hypothetical protein
MKKWKRSIGLSSTSLALAIGMSATGAHQYEIDHRLHLEYFSYGNIITAPQAHWMSYCLNAP